MPSPSRRVAQAIDALRHGWPVMVRAADTELASEPPAVLSPVETSIGHGLSSFNLLISSARAATLKLTNQREAARDHSPVLIRAADLVDLKSAKAIADPALDLAVPLKGPFKAQLLDWRPQAEAALELARLAGILPAFLVNPSNAGEAVELLETDLAAWRDNASLTIATRASLPTSSSETAEIVAFRKIDDMYEHCAIIVGQQSSDSVPLVRLHSECLTGDVFGSLKCDCGPQLDAALAAMAVEAANGGWGVLLYLRQEGRGIGLINKLKAYRLQDQGFDTLEANRRLGLPEEARDFPVAARMLQLLGVRAIRLMTNNPLKVSELQAAGITVVDRVPHALPANPHNERYLSVKRDKAGHLLD